MKSELKYGLVTGAILSLVLGAGYLLGSHGVRLALGKYGAVGSSVALVAMLVPLLRQKRAAAPDGRLSLVEGTSAGVFASLVAALVVCSLLFAYNRYINPDWLDNALDWRVARMRADGISELEIRREITLYRQTGSPPGLLATTMLGMAVMSVILSLVLTVNLRPRPESHPT